MARAPSKVWVAFNLAPGNNSFAQKYVGPAAGQFIRPGLWLRGFRPCAELWGRAMLTMFEDSERERASWNDVCDVQPNELKVRARTGRAGAAPQAARKWGRYKYWTRAEIAELRRMAQQGVHVMTIARHFNLSVRAVRSYARRSRITFLYFRSASEI